MITKEILRIAMEQSAEDISCKTEDFMKDQNVIVPFRLGKKARKYLKEPITANFVSYGSNVVAAVTEDVRDLVTEYVDRYEFCHLFETPNMHWLDSRLAAKGYKICFMAEYFLPDVNRLVPVSCDYELRLLEQQDFQELYLPEWSNALCNERKQLDVLGMQAVLLIAKRCGRSGWMCCRNTEERGSRPRLPAGRRGKYLRERRFHFTAPRGPISVP